MVKSVYLQYSTNVTAQATSHVEYHRESIHNDFVLDNMYVASEKLLKLGNHWTDLKSLHFQLVFKSYANTLTDKSYAVTGIFLNCAKYID